MSSNTNTDRTHVSVGPNTTPTPNPLLQTAQGLARGDLAPNSTLQGTITQTQIALDEAKYEAPLNPKGQVLVEDVKQVLDSASRLLYEKNQDEKLQRLVGSAAAAGRETRHGVSGSGSLPLGRSDLQDFRGPARGFWDNGKSLAVFAIRSGQFREILIDLIEVFQGVADSAKRSLEQQSGQTSGHEVAHNLQNQTAVSQQQKDQLFEKFRKLLTLLGSRPEYQMATDHLLHLFDRINEKAAVLKADPNLPSSSDLPKERYDQLWQESKSVLEEFSGVGTFDELERRIWTLSHEMRADPEARAFLSRFRQFIREVTTTPALLQNQAQANYGRQLFDEAQYLFQGKYKNDFNRIFDQTKLILHNIKNDAVRSEFSAKLHKLGADFAFDEQGRPDLFVIQESLSQMRTILIPVLSKQLANLPIPKIEGANPKYDFSIDGMILHVGDLLPEFINFRTKTDTRMSVQRLATQKNTTKVVMEVDKIRALFKDIRFFYRRKRTPKIEDHGIADVDLSQGTGVSVKIVWKLKSRMNQPYLLRLLKVKCSIDRLAITVRNAKHNILDKLATKLFAGTIKKQMANAIVNNIISALQPISVRLNELFKRKPLTGVVGKANDSMKDHLFSGDRTEGGALHRAKEAVKDAANQVRDIVNKPSTTGPTPDRVIVVEEVAPAAIIVEQSAPGLIKETIIVDQPTTFVERTKGPKPWNFEWYSPAPADTVEALAVVNPSGTQATVVPVGTGETVAVVL